MDILTTPNLSATMRALRPGYMFGVGAPSTKETSLRALACRIAREEGKRLIVRKTPTGFNIICPDENYE